MNLIPTLRRQKGQTLIEALVALGIAVTIISAITSVVVSSLNNSTYSKNQDLARSYVQQSLEKIRGLVQSNYSTFLNTYSSLSYCIDDNNNLVTKSANCNSIKTGIFIREADFETQSSDCQSNLKVTVTVSWNDSKCNSRLNLYCHNVSSSTCFANLNAVPSPI